MTTISEMPQYVHQIQFVVITTFMFGQNCNFIEIYTSAKYKIAT